jgi:hypothetical protein
MCHIVPLRMLEHLISEYLLVLLVHIARPLLLSVAHRTPQSSVMAAS